MLVVIASGKLGKGGRDVTGTTRNPFVGTLWGRSAHQAFRDLWQQTMQGGGGWVLEVHIRKFFDTPGHAQLRSLQRRRLRDGVVLRLIDRWLDAGVLEEGSLSYLEAGAPPDRGVRPRTMPAREDHEFNIRTSTVARRGDRHGL